MLVHFLHEYINFSFVTYFPNFYNEAENITLKVVSLSKSLQLW